MSTPGPTSVPQQTGPGKLRIGDHWNAISIIALSQTNPLKAVAELVENSIDAKAREVVIVRGKRHGDFYLKIGDDGEGIPQDAAGVPNFRYVATHICDSVKRRLRNRNVAGIQGEFGIGLLSFWTVGEHLHITSAAADGKIYEMRMTKGLPEYEVSKRRLLVPPPGTEVTVYPLLPGLRRLTGDRIQRYLAAELRERIRKSKVRITVVDRTRRTRHVVVPRQFGGRRLPELDVCATPQGEIELELYLDNPGPENRVGLYRKGTRVLEDLTELDAFQQEPWNAGYFQGLVEVPFLNLTPGTRGGVVRDEMYAVFRQALESVAAELQALIEQQRRAEDEQTSRDILRSVKRALREAFLALPPEEYDWFQLRAAETRSRRADGADPEQVAEGEPPLYGTDDETEGEPQQPQFFEFAGPLYSARIAPRSAVVATGASKTFRAVCRDRGGRDADANLAFRWEIRGGDGTLVNADAEIATFQAPDTPGLTRIGLTVTQQETSCRADAIVTVTDAPLAAPPAGQGSRKGLPGYGFRHAPGKLWRSRFDTDANLVLINSGHRDFVFAAQQRTRKLRYICRLFCKELVLFNFPGLAPDQLLERLIELSLFTEENLR